MINIYQMFHRRNLIVIGLLLLLVFVAAVWLVGIQIDATANRMHGSMVRELGRYRSELIWQDFNKTEELGESIKEFLEKRRYDKKELSELLTILAKLDGKVSRAWFVAGEDCVVYTDSMGIQDTVLPDTLLSMKGSGLYRDGEVLYWTLCGNYQGVHYGFDISLIGLHAYFAGLVPARRNYAYILNGEGVLIAHPDERLVGNELADTGELKLLNQVIRENKSFQAPGFSDFLLLPVERLYYPITVGTEKWVIVVNIVQLDSQEAMSDFHRYTLFIAIVTVLIFSILLAFSQYRWRREYDLRRKAEQEAVQLNLQQLRNRLNPHFLFNALNSLSALISHDSSLAKEFVLNLSKVYRYVLEKRNENLADVYEEIQFARHYYFLQKIRFGEQLNLEIQDGIEESTGKIPAMSLQLLLENAVKHNEITRQHPLRIRIYIEVNHLTVENSYCPRADVSSDSLGVGFESIREIYHYYSDKQFEYRVYDNKFVCSLPLI